jgi:hypothetical protein
VMTILVMLGVTWLKFGRLDARVVLLGSAIVSAGIIGVVSFGKAGRPENIKVLLGPATADELILFRFASALSMTLFTVNIPGLMLLDPQFLLIVNAAALLLTASAIGSAVINIELEPDGFTLLAIAAVLMSSIYYWSPILTDYLIECGNWILAHPTISSIAALCAIPVIIFFSVLHREPVA